eukprot:Tamp_15943.p1 GENE.Tamp_15943~~Tamp_15943.p1  ORF type:complete len:491 (+),score=88.61 Tamp_15943:38-1474(+)
MAKAVGLPWPRGNPPKFPSPIKKHAAHWNVGAQVRCAQCGAVSNCEHKDRHARNVNQKWEDEVEGRDNRPGFFRESELFRSQVKEQPQLGIGEPLPVGMRRGWEAYPGNDDVRVDSPRRHGEWRLVFMPRDKSKDHRAAEMMQDPPKRSRSTNPVAHKQREARKKWDEENIELALDRDVLRSVSMTPGGAAHHREPMERIIKQPYSSVQQRDYFVSAQMGQMDRANKLHPSTPDLVHSLNALNNSISLPAIRDAHQGTHGSKRRGVEDQSRRHMEPVAGTQYFGNESNMSKHVFREVPSQDGETRTRKQYSYKKPSGQETKRSAMEWMDEQARSERLEKLQQQVPPTLKTKIGRGDVKPADATRDLAEAKSITALLLPPPPLPVPLFSLVPLAPSAGFLIARRWPLVSPAVRCPFRVSVHLCTCYRSRQEGWGRRTHGTQVSPGQERAMSGKLPLDAGAQGRQAEAQQARRRLCFLSG